MAAVEDFSVLIDHDLGDCRKIWPKPYDLGGHIANARRWSVDTSSSDPDRRLASSRKGEVRSCRPGLRVDEHDGVRNPV